MTPRPTKILALVNPEPSAVIAYRRRGRGGDELATLVCRVRGAWPSKRLGDTRYLIRVRQPAATGIAERVFDLDGQPLSQGIDYTEVGDVEFEVQRALDEFVDREGGWEEMSDD